MSLSRDELRAIRDRVASALAPTQPDPEPDPIVRLFNERNLPPHARLRQLYRASLEAIARCMQLKAHIDEGQRQLGTAIIRARALKPQRYELGAPIPTAADAAELAQLGAHADMLNLWIEGQRAGLGSLELRAAEAEREWEASYTYWKQYVYELTQDPRYLPPIAITRNQDLDGFERNHIAAKLAELEA